MPGQTSNIKNFIMEALSLSRYPKTIFTDKDGGCICIHLPNQHNKDKARETARMLEDYANLKPRKENDSTSNRQRFMQALKRSPYIMILPHSTATMKYIHIKGKDEARPGNVEHEPTAGPSTITEIDAGNVPEMVSGEPLECPLTPLLHEAHELATPLAGGEDIGCTSTPLETSSDPSAYLLPDVEEGMDFNLIGAEEMGCTSIPLETPSDPLASLLPDVEEGRDFNLIGLENLVASDVQFPSDSSSDLVSSIFDPDRSPDLSDFQVLDAAEEDYPNNYDPLEDFLNSRFEQGCQNNVGSSSENQLLEITSAQWVQQTENGLMVIGPVDSDGMDRSNCAVMISVRRLLHG